jgi:hypothetical protein
MFVAHVVSMIVGTGVISLPVYDSMREAQVCSSRRCCSRAG